MHWASVQINGLFSKIYVYKLSYIFFKLIQLFIYQYIVKMNLFKEYNIFLFYGFK